MIRSGKIRFVKVDRDQARRARRLGRIPGRADLEAERELERALRFLEPKVARALRNSARFKQGQIPMRQLQDAIRSGSARRVMELLEVDTIGESLLRGAGAEPGKASAIDRLLEALQSGGTAAQRQLPAKDARLIGALDITNPESLAYIRDNVPSLIQGINQESRRTIQQALSRGFSEGIPPVKIAREIRRSVGLTPEMEEAVSNFRRQLESGQLGGQTPPWERRLSAVEAQQARNLFRRETVPAHKIDALVDKYAERLLNRRASNIARTEVHNAHIVGQEELWKQGAESGVLDEDRARRFWIVTADERLREDHRQVPLLNKDGVRLNEPFKAKYKGRDIEVMGPGLSGIPGFDINCILPGTLVSGKFVAGLESWYSGDAVELITKRGMRLSVTPNHTVLTTTGLKTAGNLREGNYLVTDRSQIQDGATRSVEIQNEPARIEDVIESLAVAGGSRSLPISRFDLHDDQALLANDIRQVGADGNLKGCYFSGVLEKLAQLSLIATYVSLGKRIGLGPLQSLFDRLLSPTRSIPSRGTLPLGLLLGHLTPLQPLCFGASSGLDALLTEYPSDRMARDALLVTKFLHRGAGLVTSDEIVKVRRFPFSGHVYDLQSTLGNWIIAGGIVIRNCRCTVGLRFKR